MPIRGEDLRSCWLVWYPVKVTGGCSYTRGEHDVTVEGKKEESTWESKKVVDDVDEYKRANALRNKVKRHMRGLGAPAAPGIVLVPTDREDELNGKRRELALLVKAHNDVSDHTKVIFRCRKFRIENENQDLLEDMLGELRETLEELRDAEKAADVKTIREVVQRLVGYDTVLPPNAADYVQRAVADARAQAKDIAKSLKDKSKTIDQLRTEVRTSQVDFARFAVMEPGTELPKVDNKLVQQLIAEQAAQRFEGVELDDGDDRSASPDFAGIAANGDMV